MGSQILRTYDLGTNAEGKKAVISPERVADMFWNILHGKSPLQVIDGKFRIQDLAAKIPGVI